MKEVGSYTYGHNDIEIIHGNEGKTLRIGKFCSIAKGVIVFLGANHRIDWFTTYPFGHYKQEQFPKIKKDHGHPSTKGDVNIGNDVWIGYGVTIMSGITIGSGAVLATNSVITNYCLVQKKCKKKHRNMTLVKSRFLKG